MFPFPPPPPTTELTLHALCVFVVLALLGVVLLRPGRDQKVSDPFCWLIAGILLTVGFLHTLDPYTNYRTSHGNILTLQWIFVGIGIICTLVRLPLRKRTGGVIFFLGPIALIATSVCLLPSLDRGSGPSRRSICKNNLKQIGLALHNYLDAQESFPLHVGGEPLHSWRVELLPYLDNAALYHSYRMEENWNSDANFSIAKTQVSAYICPSAEFHDQIADADGAFWSSYAVAVGTTAIFEADHTRKNDEIPDGLSNTAMVVEACGQQIIWTEPRDLPLGTTPIGINLPGKANYQSEGMLSSYHSDGAQVLFADGSVRFVSQVTSPEVLKKLLQADDGPPGEF